MYIFFHIKLSHLNIVMFLGALLVICTFLKINLLSNIISKSLNFLKESGNIAQYHIRIDAHNIVKYEYIVVTFLIFSRKKLLLENTFMYMK